MALVMLGSLVELSVLMNAAHSILDDLTSL